MRLAGPSSRAARRVPGLAAAVAVGLVTALTAGAASGAAAGPAAAAAPSARALTDGALPVPLRPPVAAAPAVHRTVGVWLPYWNMRRASADVLRHRSVVAYASPFWYEMNGVTARTSYPGAGDRRLVNDLHAAGIKVVPTVVESMRAPAFARLLSSRANRRAHVAALVRIATSRRYDGLDLDYEYFAVTRDPAVAAANRAAFTAIATDLCARLHRLGKICTITVMARTTDERVVWRNKLSTWIFDYRALGAVADKIRIMAYSEHARTPGYITSTAWLQAIVDYATARVPAGRLDVSLATYGYVWRPGSGTRSTTYAGAKALRAKVGAPLQRDPASGEPWFRWRNSAGTTSTCWYTDAAALRPRVRLLRARGVTVGLWVPGTEDPALWPALVRASTY